MIVIFKYRNKQGRESTKIIAKVGSDGSTRFCGLSLGKALLNSPYDLNQVLSDYAGFKELDHMPKRGEGLPTYNSIYKMFLHGNVQSVIGKLNCKPENFEAITHIVKALKDLDTTENERASASAGGIVTESFFNASQRRLAESRGNRSVADAFAAGFQGINYTPANSTLREAYELGQEAAKYDCPEEFKESLSLKEAILTDADMELMFTDAYEKVFSKWIDSDLGYDDYEDAFKLGFDGEDLPDVEYLPIEGNDYDYYEIAYSFGKKAARVSSVEEFSAKLSDND